MLSPQVGFLKHTPARGQVKPFSTLQPAAQPLPACGGSHVSVSSMMLLPQTAGVEVSGLKLLQPGRQPALPGGSQISPGSTLPLPQAMLLPQTLGSELVQLKNGSTRQA